jgi:predicted negative regulator of RcsB-dependent stress response
MSPQRLVNGLFRTEIRTIIVIVYAVGLLILTGWVVWQASQAPSRTDLQKVVISVCQSVNEGHDRSKISAAIITKQAKVIENIIAKATASRPNETSRQQLMAARLFKKFVNKQEDAIIAEAQVFRNVPDTNCNEAK